MRRSVIPLLPPLWVEVFGEDDSGIFAEFELAGVRFVWRWVPPGRFTMGSPKDETGRWDEEGPQREHTHAGTHRVRLKQPNGWGLYDMLGNVWEWCADVWSDYKTEAAEDPAHKSGDESAGRVVRGGSWGNRARYCRTAYRDRRVSSYRSRTRGFRLAAG